jgi:hypothetical protein
MEVKAHMDPCFTHTSGCLIVVCVIVIIVKGYVITLPSGGRPFHVQCTATYSNIHLLKRHVVCVKEIVVLMTPQWYIC